jgi:23S rRNA pseudouridine2605 synthase
VSDPPPERLQKVLARGGFGSRRTCELLIESGRVTVNGEVAVLGRRVDVERDKVAVDDILVSTRAGLVYYLLNKPSGVVTTARDPQGRPTVIDLLPLEPRVFPVGRLDADTEGLLVLTNDGDLTHHLTHPSFGVEKEYLAQVEGRPSPAALRRLREGVELDDGVTAPAGVRQIRSGVLELTLREGRKRQVRRMCAAVGHPVRKLRRVGFGPLRLGDLGEGKVRRLSPAEVQRLRDAARPAGRGRD